MPTGGEGPRRHLRAGAERAVRCRLPRDGVAEVAILRIESRSRHLDEFVQRIRRLVERELKHD